MTLSRTKYRRLTDLYVVGTELVLRDGNVLWLQVLNPFEADEARHDAMVARARMVMALREHGSDELLKVRSTVMVDGREETIDRLVETKQIEALISATDAIANDPEWKERLEIAQRQEEIFAREPTDPERLLLDKINADYVIATNTMVEEEMRELRVRYEALDESGLLDEYTKFYIERRGTDVAIAEHRLTEIWYAARCCEGLKGEDGTWNHDACEGHSLRIYDAKRDVRDLPGDLVDLLNAAITDLNMTVREAKNSDRQGSGSASSPLPSEVEESTPSTPDVTLEVVPGTSLSPSPMP